jgi:hypothetical protein
MGVLTIAEAQRRTEQFLTGQMLAGIARGRIRIAEL